MEAEEANKAESSPTTTTDSETLVSATEPNQQPTRHQNPLLAVEEEGENRIGGSKSIYSLDQKEIVRALEIVERDSVAIAESFTSLFASLRLALSEATSTSVDHMHCFSDAAGRLQECALDAATKGNRYINSCLRYQNETSKDMRVLSLICTHQPTEAQPRTDGENKPNQTKPSVPIKWGLATFSPWRSFNKPCRAMGTYDVAASW